MKRRKFLQVAAAGAGAAALGPLVGCTPVATSPTPLDVKGYLKEPARRIPVVDRADVLVLGGGPAGVAAAVSAAREGADVLLVERQYYLGGLWTGCCVLPVNNTDALLKDGSWRRVVRGFSEEICTRLTAMGMCIDIKEGSTPVPDPEAAKYVLERMLEESGVRLLYNCQGADILQSGDRVDALILETKSGRVAVQAGLFVDASGDGDILEWAGEDFDIRRHQIGAMWRCGNAGALQRKGVLDTPVKGVKLFHTHGEMEQDGLDIYNLTRLQVKLRRQMWETAEEDRRQPGCEDLFLLDSTSLLGVRSTRVLRSLHNVTFDESLRYTHYDDCIGIGGADPWFSYRDGTLPGRKRPAWQIPYRSLVPRKVPNLLVAGRCFGYDEQIVYDAREVATCFVTGQAAGVAAACAVLGRTDVRSLDIPHLRHRLQAQGVNLGA